MKIGHHETHPVADLFPLMDEEGLAALAADVAALRLREPVLLFQGKILDGRNRALACERAGVPARFEEWTGEDPLALVLSKNLHRRHLNDTQRALVAARALSLFREAARERQSQAGGDHQCPHPPLSADRREAVASKGKAAEHAAAALDVSSRSVERARAVLEHGHESLLAAVESEEIPLSVAAEIAAQNPTWIQPAYVAYETIRRALRWADEQLASPNLTAEGAAEVFKVTQQVSIVLGEWHLRCLEQIGRIDAELTPKERRALKAQEAAS